MKLNKQRIIELFESRLLHRKTRFNVFKSNTSGNYQDGIEFTPIDRRDFDLIEDVFRGECNMILTQNKDKYFIEFNTLRVEISFEEFLNLSTRFKKAQTEEETRKMKARYEMDLKFLNRIFEYEAQKETRKTITEKRVNKKVEA